jgi:hypothetical protein
MPLLLLVGTLELNVAFVVECSTISFLSERGGLVVPSMLDVVKHSILLLLLEIILVLFYGDD